MSEITGGIINEMQEIKMANGSTLRFVCNPDPSQNVWLNKFVNKLEVNVGTVGHIDHGTETLSDALKCWCQEVLDEEPIPVPKKKHSQPFWTNDWRKR